MFIINFFIIIFKIESLYDLSVKFWSEKMKESEYLDQQIQVYKGFLTNYTIVLISLVAAFWAVLISQNTLDKELFELLYKTISLFFLLFFLIEFAIVLKLLQILRKLKCFVEKA
jgi:hypothetical protein